MNFCLFVGELKSLNFFGDFHPLQSPQEFTNIPRKLEITDNRSFSQQMGALYSSDNVCEIHDFRAKLGAYAS